MANKPDYCSEVLNMSAIIPSMENEFVPTTILYICTGKSPNCLRAFIFCTKKLNIKEYKFITSTLVQE